LGGNLDFLPSNIKGDGNVEVARDCDRKSNVCVASDQRTNGTTGPRTGPDANAILVVTLGTESHKRSIELLDAFGIANDLSGASVVNCRGRSNHWHREESRQCDSDQIEG
jgi:hypothetical protein